MVPITARGPADGRHRGLPAGPGAVRRFALRVAGWGRRPAVAWRPAGRAPRACGPRAI
jgi:hypothetical protein